MPDNDFPVYRMNTGPADRMSRFCHSHNFFTLAAMFRYGWLQRRVIRDFLDRCPVPAHFVSKQFQHRLVDGLVEPDGFFLWVIEAAAWPYLCQFLSEVVISDPVGRQIYRAKPEPVSIIDPLYIDSGGSPLAPEAPQLPITIFWVDGSEYSWRVVRRDTGPAIEMADPLPETTAYGKSIFHAFNEGPEIADLPVVFNGSMDPIKLPLIAKEQLPDLDKAAFDRGVADYKKAFQN